MVNLHPLTPHIMPSYTHKMASVSWPWIPWRHFAPCTCILTGRGDRRGCCCRRSGWLDRAVVHETAFLTPRSAAPRRSWTCRKAAAQSLPPRAAQTTARIRTGAPVSRLPSCHLLDVRLCYDSGQVAHTYRERKCAEKHNKWHNEFFLRLPSAFW